MSEGTVKQVKVDNWGIFFLQRLQQLFSKSEHCDLVLQFSTNERVRVHRLVLNACTEYFQLLEKQGCVTGDCLHMPAELQSDVVVPIINFMYTGKLEFRTELHRRLYSTAQQMNMIVLTKLLDAQNSSLSPQQKPIIRRPSTVPITYNLQGKKIAPKHIDPDLPETLPGRKLPIWKRRNVPINVPSYYEESSNNNYDSSKHSASIIDESPRPTRFEWPEENVDTSYSSSFDDLSYETKPLLKPQIFVTNKPTTTKIETTPRVATFEDVCRTATNMKRFASAPIEHDEAAAKKAKIVDLQAVKEYVQEHRLRKHLLDSSEENGEEVDDDLAVADLDDDDDDMDEEDGDLSFGEVSGQPIETTLKNDFQPNIVASVVTSTPLASQPQVQQQFQIPVTTLPTSSILQLATSSTSPTTPVLPASSLSTKHLVLPPQKSILKAQASHEECIPTTPVSMTSKKVRFLLDAKLPEGKENTVAAAVSPAKVRRIEDVQRPLPTRAENISAVGGPVTGNLSNHAKIITEVLKKYPHLVKNNKNIRLKIMQRGGTQVTPVISAEGDASKMVKSKVSYVVLKSDIAGAKGKPAVVLKHGGHVEPLSELGSQKTVSGAENTTGPWLCHSCGTNEEPIHFESYYLYRRHLQDVHMEKIDARICEHCGHRASKRNLLLYHLYTKHGVPPPRNCQFPKCDQCDYVALSESLLIRHRNNHSNNKEFVCKVCNAAFKSNGALQGHMQTNLHSDPAKKLYECPFCQKPFVRNINLKAHIRTSHKEVIRKIDEEEKLHMEGAHKQFGSLQHFEDGEEAHSSDVVGDESMNAEEDEDGDLMEVDVKQATTLQKQSSNTVLLPPGVTVLTDAPAVQSLVPSSEAEALSNVASGIAASLGLADTLIGEQTVIVLDENQEFVLHSTEIVGEETTCTEERADIDETSLQAGELQEYIVPEMMPEAQDQQEQYAGPLSDLEHYSGEGHSTITVTSSQPTAPPPPVSVAVSVVGGDEVTMVLTDHDYAPLRDSNGEGVMFFIAQPTDQVIEHDVKYTVDEPDPEPDLEPESEPDLELEPETEPHIPVLEKEPAPPELTAESFNAIPIETKYTVPPVLTREIVETVITTDGNIIDSNVLVQETNSATDIVEFSTLATCSTENIVQITNQIQETVVGQESERSENSNESCILENQVRIEETEESGIDVRLPSISEECTIHEETEVIEESVIEDINTNQTRKVRTYSTIKSSDPTIASIRRQPPVQMADLMKEWDDFEDEEQDSKAALKVAKEVVITLAKEVKEEPRILRGPITGD